MGNVTHLGPAREEVIRNTEARLLLQRSRPGGGQKKEKLRGLSFCGWKFATGHDQQRLEQAQAGCSERQDRLSERHSPDTERFCLTCFHFTAYDAPSSGWSCRGWLFSHDAAGQPAKAPRQPRSQRVCGQEW